MIESVAGIIIGILLGTRIDPGYGTIGGAMGLLAFLALADELAAMLKGSRGGPVAGLAVKTVFCGAAVWIQGKTGAPTGVFAILILMVSIYWRIAAPNKTAAGVK